MKVVVNKRALKRAINLIVNEERTISSTRIDTIAGKVGQEIEEDTELSPISASEQMATQLTVDAPPVSDPDYIPMSTVELANAAAVISKEVPETQIEYFYRQLHSLLDKVYDKDKENMAGAEDGEMSLDGSEEGMQINESLLAIISKRILKEAEEEGEEAEMTPDEEEELFDKPMGSELKSDITAIDIAQMFIDKGLHWLPLIQDKDSDEGRAGSVATAPAAVPDPVTGDATLGKKNMKISVSPDEVDKLIMSTIKSDDLIKRKFARYARENQIDTDVARRNVADALLVLLGKREGAPITLELAAEMHANITSDNAWRSAEADMDEFEKHMQSAIAETNQKDEIEIRPSGAKIQKKIKVPSDMVVHFLEKAIENRIAGNVSDPYADSDDEEYDMDQASELSAEEQSAAARDRELKNLKRLDGLAPYFGFKNASGIRQWRRKYADPKLKVLMGSNIGKSAYDGYSEFVNDTMGALLDSLVDVSENLLGNEKFKAWGTEEGKAFNKVLPDLLKDFSAMQESMFEDDNEDETIDMQMLLSTDGGKVVRQVFNDMFLNKEFSDFAAKMRKHMIKSIKDAGADDKAANTFSKMFNGEVDLASLNDESSNSKKLIKLGITPQIYKKAIKDSEKFTKDFFTGKRKKETAAKLLDKLKDSKYLADLLEKGIAGVADADEIERQIKTTELPPEEREKLDSLTESQINLLIRKLLVR